MTYIDYVIGFTNLSIKLSGRSCIKLSDSVSPYLPFLLKKGKMEYID